MDLALSGVKGFMCSRSLRWFRQPCFLKAILVSVGTGFTISTFVVFVGVFQCVREMNNDYEDVYVDGGLLCNYPIHAFDGKLSCS